MAVKFETLPDLWKVLDRFPRRILLYLAKTTDWNEKGKTAKEIAEATGISVTDVRRWVGPLEAHQLVDREEEKPRWTAARVVFNFDETTKFGKVDWSSMRDGLIDLGIIEPDPTLDVKLTVRFDLALSTACKLAEIFPRYNRHDRVSGRARFAREDLGNALDLILPDLLADPKVQERLQIAREHLLQQEKMYDARQEAEEEERKAWIDAHPEQSWRAEQTRREEEREREATFREAAELRAEIDAEAQLLPDPERFFVW